MNQNKNILICAGGDKPTHDIIKDSISKYRINFFIGADRGAECLMSYNIIPDIVIGDFDSINPDILKKINPEKIIRLPRKKDFTDTQAAINNALKYKPNTIILTGVTGQRSDHFITNLFLLKFLLDKKINALIIDNYCKINLINHKFILKKSKGMEISILPFTDRVSGVTLKGFLYPLTDAELKKENPYTVSNIITDDFAEIELKKGILINFEIFNK